VHTLEAAKALLVAQAAAAPSQVEEVFDDEELLDVEAESEVETDETEGLVEDSVGGDEESTEAGTDGPRRKRRRRRRGRGNEPREGAIPRPDNSLAPEAGVSADADIAADDGEPDEEESGEQPNQARPDQGSGERRPRRRGRRGGRRRRGGPEDGLAGSIADELGPVPVPEAASADADFDGVSSQPSPSPSDDAPQTHPAEQPATVQPSAPSAAEAEAHEAEKAARRRSTVREKVSFGSSAQAEPAAPSSYQPQPASAEAHSEPAQETGHETTTEAAQPRRAGWWSRRFGGGE
jgi:ribonuclease E